MVDSFSDSSFSLCQRLGANDLILLRNVVAKFWSDFVAPYWLNEDEPAQEEKLFLRALRSQFNVKDLSDKRDVISIALQKQTEHDLDVKTLRDRS